MDFQKTCMDVCDIARLAGDFIAQQRLTFSSDKVELKGYQNLVSYVDKEAEKMIVRQLQRLLPQAAILGEEGTTQVDRQNADTTQVDHQNADTTQVDRQNAGTTQVDRQNADTTQVDRQNAGTTQVDRQNEDSEYRWVIDPLDGTTNFVHGMPPYCVSIALTRNDQVVVGVIYEITIGECFYAWEGSAGAYLDGKEIHVSTESEIANSLVISGFAYEIGNSRERFNQLFDHFNRVSHGARRTGSAAANLAYIAAGRAECFYQSNLSPWDVAAGALIVERAGGKVTDFSNTDNYIFGQEIVASNGVTHNKFLEIVR